MSCFVLCRKENEIGTSSTDFVSDTPGGVSLRDLINGPKMAAGKLTTGRPGSIMGA